LDGSFFCTWQASHDAELRLTDDDVYRFFLALGAYFAIGAYHNYTNYGASGWDLVPYVSLVQPLSKRSHRFAVIVTFGETFRFYCVILCNISLTQSVVALAEAAITLYDIVLSSTLYMIGSNITLPVRWC
jgi:hypothetical protein